MIDITYIYLALVLIATIYGFIFFKKLSQPFKYLVILICAAFAFESFDQALYQVGRKTDNFIFHFSIIAFVFINLLIYLQVLKNARKIIKRIAIFVTVAALIGTILNSFFYQKYPGFPSIGISLHAAQSIILSLLAFQEMIKQPLRISLAKQPLFWLNAGNLLFYSITFLIFAFFNFYTEMDSVLSWLLPFISIASFVMYCFYFRALYLDKNRVHAN